MKKKLQNFLTNNGEYFWLTTIILFVVSFNFFSLGNALLHGISLTNTLDLSWQTDSIERLLHGYLAGRDFIFTYGPLFQIIYTIPTFIFNQPSYIAVLYAPIILSVINCILLYLIIHLTLRSKKTAVVLTAVILFALGLITYDQNILFRILLPFIYGLLLVRFVTIKKPLSLRSISLLMLPAIFGLYTFDLFIIGFLITILFIGYDIYTILRKNKHTSSFRQSLIKGIFYSLLVVLFVFLASILLSGNLNYLLYSYDTIQNYQFVMSIPWTLNKYSLLLLLPIVLCFLLLKILKHISNNHDKKVTFVVLTVIAILELKSAIVRSDDGHVIMGIYPSLIVLTIIFPEVLQKKVKSLFLLILITLQLVILFRHPTNILNPFPSMTSSLSLLATPKPFFSLYRLSSDYYFSQEDFRRFESLITHNPGKVMIYPYDTYILNIYGTTYNTVALQFYQYSNSVVEKASVEKLHNNPPKFIILGVDDKGAVRLDNIPNFSRNSILAKWMLENYSVEKNTDKYLILHYDLKKQKQRTMNYCAVYDIDTTPVVKSNIIDKTIKSSIYYLTSDTRVRLPYTPSTSSIFFVDNFNNAKILQTLFESNINFERYTDEKKHMQIIKKYPIPKLMKTFNENFSVKCY